MMFGGLDVAKKRDASAFVLLSRNDDGLMRVEDVVEWWGKDDRMFFTELITNVKTIAQIEGMILISVDSTGLGDPVLEFLQFKDDSTGPALGGLVKGIIFTNETKTKMMDNLIIVLEQGMLEIHPKFKKLRNQILLQEVDVKAGKRFYSHPESGEEDEYFSVHDDQLWALCMAVDAAWGISNSPGVYTV